MDDLLADYPVRIEVPVAWGDMDAFAHVNNLVYFRWFESARIAYFDRVEALATKQDTGIGPILASTSCRFKIPLTYPDTIVAAASVQPDTVGEDRFTMAYAVASQHRGRVAAQGAGEIVAFDYGRGRKAPIPDALRQRILDLG